jgi:HEAT repeat protein
MSRRSIPAAAAALLVFGASGCEQGDDKAPAASAYVATVDLAREIRDFGEETATADEAGERVAKMGDAAVPALAGALERESVDVRKKAVEVLGDIGTPAAVPALMAAAERDADESIRGDALRALGAIGDERAHAVLSAALRDTGLHVRAGGVVGCATLCRSGEDIDRIAEIAAREAHRRVAAAARATLSSLRQAGSGEDAAVRRAIDARRPLLQTGSPDERALVALLVSGVDEGGAPAALAATLEHASHPLQRQVSWRLGAVGDAGAIAPLSALLSSPDQAVRLYAADALINLRERGVAGAGQAIDAYAGVKPARPLGPPEY